MLPDKYINKIKELLGEKADSYFASFEQKHYAGLRVNTLKIDVEDFKKISHVELEQIPWTYKGFYYNIEDKPAKHPYYYAGLFYIQEPSAMAPASILPIEEHDKVLDLCAAPGGKSTELAAKLNGTGLLVTNDISPSRAKALLKNIELSGVKNAIVTSEAPFKLCSLFEGFFDKILVDAPCSGEGMFRKDPAIIKNWEQYGVEYYSKLQKEIILYAADMLKPGGYMVYSTCTFSPEEDEGTMKYLLDNRPDFKIEKIKYDFGDNGHKEWLKFIEDNTSFYDDRYNQIENTARLWPQNIKGEGHFVALLKKDNEADKVIPKISKLTDNLISSKKKGNIIPDEFFEFLKHIDIDIDFDYNRFIVNKDRVFYIPEGRYDVKNLKVLRNGLLMGEIKTKRFVPSQALASSLRSEQFDNRISFDVDDINVIKYLKGESIEINNNYFDDNGKLIDKYSTPNIKDGWCLICVNGFSLGFGKLNGNTIKNKYLPGWRWM